MIFTRQFTLHDTAFFRSLSTFYLFTSFRRMTEIFELRGHTPSTRRSQYLTGVLLKIERYITESFQLKHLRKYICSASGFTRNTNICRKVRAMWKNPSNGSCFNSLIYVYLISYFYDWYFRCIKVYFCLNCSQNMSIENWRLVGMIIYYIFLVIFIQLNVCYKIHCLLSIVN